MTTNLTQRIMHGAKVGLVGLALITAIGCTRGTVERTDYSSASGRQALSGRVVSSCVAYGNGEGGLSAMIEANGTTVLAHKHISLNSDAASKAGALLEAAKNNPSNIVEMTGKYDGTVYSIDSIKYKDYQIRF